MQQFNKKIPGSWPKVSPAGKKRPGRTLLILTTMVLCLMASKVQAQSFAAGWFHSNATDATQNSYWATAPTPPIVLVAGRDAAFVASAGNELVGGGITQAPLLGASRIYTGVPTTGFVAGSTAYLEYSFTTANNGGAILSLVGYGVNQPRYANAQITVAISANNFASSTFILNNSPITPTPSGYQFRRINTSSFFLAGNTTYRIRVYFHSRVNSSTTVPQFGGTNSDVEFDDFQIGMTPCATLTSTQTNVTCFGASTGAIDLTVNGGSGAFTYAWTGPSGFTANTQDLSARPAGTYNVTVTDTNGCSATTSVTLTQAAALVPPTATPTQPTCSSSTGSINISAPAPAAGITYSINGTTYTNTNGIFTGLAAGTYPVTYRNSAGCTSPATSIVINAQPATPTALIATATQSTCAAQNSLTLSGFPAGNWTLTIQPSNINVSGNTSSVTYVNQTPGTYTYTVTNAAGCTSPASTATFNAAPTAPVAPTASTTVQPTCTVPTGTIVVSSPAQGTGFEYNIDGGTYQASATFTLVAPGSHNITVRRTADNTCISAATAVTVAAVPGAPTAPIAAVTQPTCASAANSLTLSGLPATGTWTITVLPGNATVSGTGTSATYVNIAPGTYTYTVTNAAGCTSPQSASVTFNPQPTAPVAPTASTTVQPTCTVPTGTIVVSSPAQGTGFEYNIDGGTYQASATFTLVAPGSHNITVRRTADNTCISAPTAVTVTAAICSTVSGTLFNDNNGATGGVNGTPMPAGTTVTLYASDGITVIATTTTDASGNYSFPNTVPGNYVIGVTPPAGFQNVSSTDATPTNGLTSVTVGSTALPGVNFGLNQPPTATADLLSNQAPGSPATMPNILGNDTDPNGGALSPDSISLVVPVGATGAITDAQGDVTGFTVPGQGTWALNPNGSITFTPLAGFTGDPTPISYTVTDGAGLNSTPTAITIDYNPPVAVSGTLFNDNNGTTGGTNGTPMPAGTTVTLYASNGTTVIATATTDASGNYSFPGIVPGNYVVGVTPPAGFQNVSSTDATPTNGLTSVTVGSTALPGVNFGLNQPPTATADLLSNQAPGSPATMPSILGNDTDPNGGTLSPDSITLVAPPGATGITTDAQGDVTGFTVTGQGTWALNSSTGAVTFTPVAGFTGDPTPISYTVTDGAGLNSAPTAITVDYNPPVTVSGTLFNDNNGTSGSANGTPMPAGTTVTLYASNGTTVIATATTDASGNYSFPGIVPGNYVVGVTPPADFQNVSSTDASPTNGLTSVTVGSTAVPGVNFGLNQPPATTGDLLANQAPGSTATVPNILANDTDPNGGTLSPDSITLVAPPGATGITTDAQGDVTGFTVTGQGTWALNSSTGAVTFTPVAGFTGDPTSISYTVTDGAGLNSTPTAITIDYNPPVTVSGTVYNDNNAGSPDGTPSVGTTVTLYANDGTTVLATTTTDANGNYSFPNIPPGNYQVQVTPPAGFQNVSSSDGTPLTPTPVTVGATAITGTNFGVNEPPQASTNTATTSTPPSGTGSAPVAPANFGGNDPNTGVIDSLRITGFPTNSTSITIGTTTYYPDAGSIPPGCSTCVVFPAGGVTIPTTPGGQPTVAISVDPAGTTATTVQIPYTVIDNAHLSDPTPGVLTLPFDAPLPVEWLYLTATSTGKDVLLQWATAMEKNTDYFEAEYATDGSQFRKLGQVAAAGNSSVTHTYSFKHIQATTLGVPMLQYRIRQVDRDGQYTYSEVRSVRIDRQEQTTVTVYPNPVSAGNSLTVTADKINDIQVFNATGSKVWSGRYSGEKRVTIPTTLWSAGTYLIRVNNTHTIKFLVK